MKKTLSLLLSAILLLSTLAGALSGMALFAAAEDISGVREIEFARNGTGGSPYMSGLNNPVGYAFTLDDEVRLLEIKIPDFATYSNNVNRGTFKLYQWKGDRNSTVAGKPLVEREIVNHADHSDLILEIPAEAKITGALYFEVICLEGSSYTPWNAEGGLIDPVEGVVTDMQAYLGGNPANPFACNITVCDMENKSPSAFVTFTYDFSKGLEDGKDVNQTNQIKIENKQGYVTFTAEGEDPYFRFSDDYQPTPATNQLAYAVIEYRTTASIAKGEFFTNRKSGAHWGDPNAYVTWDYIPDGEWHTVVVDASEVWGNDKTDELYAFRFDPLASGAKAGDSIDVASIKFFEDRGYAHAYATDREASIREDESLMVAEGSDILDFGVGKHIAGLTPSEGVKVFVENEFTRLYADGAATVTVSGLEINPSFRFVTLMARTESASVSEGITITAKAGDAEAMGSYSLPCDGYWTPVTVELPLNADGSPVDTLTITIPEGWVDITYIGFFEKPEYSDKYVYPNTLSVHQFILGTADVPVYNVTDPTLGSPFCSGGQSMGQKFTATSPVRGVIIPGHATWGADPANNSGYFKLFKWNKDYKTTVSGTPLYTEELKNLKDGEDLIITFDELPAGEYCFEIKMTTPGDKAYTGFNTASGKGTEGTISFRNGAVNDNHLVAGYLTAGKGLVDVGPEYAMDATFEYDFTRHYDSITESLGLNNVNGMTVTDLCDQGYLAITARQSDPYFAFGVNPAVTSNLMDHIVIKYRMNSTAKSGELFVERSDGATWGNPYEQTNLTWDWQATGKWAIAVIDASAVWGNVYGVTLQNIRFDPLEKPSGADETIDVAYIKFFSNAKAAEACAAAEYVEEDGKTVVKAPLRPIDPATVKPVILIEGEALNVTGGTQMHDAAYSYERGFITYSAKGNDPSFFLYRESTKVAPFMAVKYRTTAGNAGCEVYAGSVQTAPNGRSDRVTYRYTADGEWHIAVIDLRKAADYDADTGKVNYLRFDFLHSDSGLSGTATLDVEYVAFFNSYDEAMVYPHELPDEKARYTATFVVEGKALYTVEFRAGDTTLEEPVVPILPGLIGTWEPYTLGNADITINAVYTPVAESNVPDVPPLPSDDADEEPETNVPAVTDDPSEDTDPAVKKGCGSALSLPFIPLLLLAAAPFGKRKYRL